MRDGYVEGNLRRFGSFCYIVLDEVNALIMRFK
jgi:hypothetical protein